MRVNTGFALYTCNKNWFCLYTSLLIQFHMYHQIWSADSPSSSIYDVYDAWPFLRLRVSFTLLCIWLGNRPYHIKGICCIHSILKISDFLAVMSKDFLDLGEWRSQGRWHAQDDLHVHHHGPAGGQAAAHVRAEVWGWPWVQGWLLTWWPLWGRLSWL